MTTSVRNIILHLLVCARSHEMYGDDWEKCADSDDSTHDTSCTAQAQSLEHIGEIERTDLKLLAKNH